MRIVLLFFLMIFVTCCNSPFVESPYALSQKELLVGQVIKKALVQLKKDKELYPFGTAARMLNQIKMLGLSLHYYEPVDIEKARELLIYSTELFLDVINNNNDIRFYLQSYPFTAENVEIRIYLQKTNGSEPDLGDLTIVEMTNGILEYVIRNKETKRLTTLYEESFREAKVKLAGEVAI
jgi:hypothetical protein